MQALFRKWGAYDEGKRQVFNAGNGSGDDLLQHVHGLGWFATGNRKQPYLPRLPGGGNAGRHLSG